MPSYGLSLDDHPGFHRAALGALLGASMGAAAAAGLSARVAGAPTVTVGALVGLTVGLGIAERPRSAVVTGARLCAIAAGVGATALGGAWALVPLSLAAIVCFGTPRARLLWMVPIAALAGLAAVWAAGRASEAQALASWPAPLAHAAAGALLGAIAAAALAARYVVVATDPILAAWRALPPLHGEPRELAARGLAIWEQSATMRDDDRALVAGGITTLFAVAARAGVAPVVDDAELAARIAALDARITATTDEVAAGQYREARAALTDQRRYAAQVGAARERIIARMHHCVATLEKFRLAYAHADVAAAAREAADARTAVAVLADLSAGLTEPAPEAEAARPAPDTAASDAPPSTAPADDAAIATA